MAEYALRLENGTDTAPRVRLGEAAVRFPAGSLAARGGLRPDGGGAVTVVAGTMDVEVSPLLAYVNGGSSSTQGGYPFVLDAAKTLTLSDGDGALSRTDTVAVVVNETAYDGSGFTDAAVVVVEGTPGAGAPVLPPSCVPLRDVTVPAGLSAGTGGLASGNLSTDRRVFTVAAGGVLPVASVTERDTLTPVAGLTVYRTDIEKLQTYDGAAWDTYVRTSELPAGGLASVSLNGSGYAFINHGMGVTPSAVVASQASHVGNALSFSVTEVDSTRFRVTCRDDTGAAVTSTSRNVYWIAIP